MANCTKRSKRFCPERRATPAFPIEISRRLPQRLARRRWHCRPKLSLSFPHRWAAIRQLNSLGAKPAAILLEGCDPQAAAFNWFDKGVLSPVKDQKNCGDCFVFAATAAFKASW
ncbi:hypothetical protein XH92_35750 [Bradyrhizobium sp. CCBAU 53421]|nr:hypothetical protein XH92_35750 [Bradyrhizobium sp. CCBAU 53421]